MKCTCTWTPRIAPHWPGRRRRTWPSRLLTRAKQRRLKCSHQLQVMMMLQLPSSWEQQQRCWTGSTIMESTLTRKRSSSQVARANPSSRWIATIVVNLDTLLTKFPSQRRTSTRRRTKSKMTQVMMRGVTRSHTRRKVASRRSTTRRRMARLRLLWLAHRHWKLKWWFLWQWEWWWEGCSHCHRCYIATILSTIYIVYTPMSHG